MLDEPQQGGAGSGRAAGPPPSNPRAAGTRLPPFASWETILAGLIVVAALVLRLLGVGRGLPYLHEWDEPWVMSKVIGMLQRGDLNPNSFVYPSAYYYLLLPVTYLHYWYLHAHGLLPSPWEIQVTHPYAPQDIWYLSPASFYLWGRALTSALAAATVYLVYRIGKIAYVPTVGLLAAAFLAVAPGAVYYADTVRVDIPMAFFVVLTMLAGLSVIRRGRWQDYVAAGLLGGLAISTKTNASIVVLPLAVAHLLSAGRTRFVSLRAAAMALGVAAGFAIGTPYALIYTKGVFATFRESALAYGGTPSFTAMRQVLPRYLSYLAYTSQGGEGYVIPHAGLGLLPAAASALGLIVGFLWNRRLQIYLLSFPVPFILFMSGQGVTYVRNVAAVLPFAALFAGVGCVWVWQALQIRWSTIRLARPPIRIGLATAALIVLIAPPGRETAALGWTMGHQPDTRTTAVAWLLQHVSAGTRVAMAEDFRWYLPDVSRLPYTVLFAPWDAPLSWYVQRRVGVAVIGTDSPLVALPSVAVFRRPAYLGNGYEAGPSIRFVVDPTLYVVRPGGPEISTRFPATVRRREMALEPIKATGDAVYSETVHIPAQRMPPGAYTLTVSGTWPRAWTALNFAPTTLTVKVRVNGQAVQTLTLTGSQPLRFTTPAFHIDGVETVDAEVQLAFWIQNLQTLDKRFQTEWAFHASSGCAVTPDAPALNVRRLTLEAWIYPEGMNETPGESESEAPVLTKGKHLGYYLRLVGDRNHRILADLSVAGKSSVGRAPYVPLHRWTHIAATYDGREARIYLNGLPAPPERDPHYAGTVHAAGWPLAIGCQDPGARDPSSFKGLITEVRVWNRVLPPDAIWDEARLHMLPDTAAGLVGSWSFQSLVRGLIPDLTGMSHHLDATGLQRVPITTGPLARPVWRFGELTLLDSVTINRLTP